MSEEIPPVTFVHISDLHVGKLDPVTGNALLSPFVRNVMANSTWFDGVLGHHSRGLEHLAKFWKTLRAQEPYARLIVSGDVTSCGADDEFDNANRYLAAKLAMPFGAIGLDFPSWQKFSIPGNHDHWPGVAKIFGQPVPTVKSQFLGGYPLIETIPRGAAEPIHLIHINTDSDVSPYGRHRLFAIGDFQTQLTAAATKLASLAQHGVRALIMHHSWHKKGALRISRASRGALSQFLEQEDIRVVLTGHVHIPLLAAFNVPSKASKPFRVYECRCGTTTQADSITYDSKSLFGGFPLRPDWPANTLLVHRITTDISGTPVWRVQVFVRMRRGFTPISGSSRAFRL
jgi:3',5'-cyclic AMP phosphodiesterase CpdA